MTSPGQTPSTSKPVTTKAATSQAATSTPASGAPGAGKLSAATAKALQVALAAEQVAVWAYDLVAAYDPADAAEIETIRAGHLARQGATASLLTKGGAAAPGPAPAYSLPRPVTNVVSARALSAVIEGDCAAAWLAVIGTTDSGTLRTTALAGLSDSAVWLTTLKIAAKTNPATVPFPGRG